MSKGFLDIKKLNLPETCATLAIDHLQWAGRRSVEGVALWSGIREGNVFTVRRTIVPKQKAGSLEEGLIYVVPGDELHRISLELFDAGEQLIAQIHSHPGRAYHSNTDDAYPIITVIGGISIVVPNFGIGGVNIKEWAIYRLSENNKWIELSLAEKTSFIEIIKEMP